MKHKVVGQIRAEGNNGGDILTITQKDEGTLYVECGHCCVYIFNGLLPVEILTALIQEAMRRHGSLENFIRQFGWSEDFTEKLAAKIEHVKWPDMPPVILE